MSVNISVDVKGLDDVIKQFNAVPGQIKRARKRAIKKTVKQIVNKGRKAMADEHHIPQKVLKKSGNYGGRVLSSTSRSGAGGSVWFGNNPIKSGYLGRLRDAPSHGGAFARDFYFKGGFIATMRSGHTGIFARDGRKRLPISETDVALDRADALIRNIAKESRGLFKLILQRELNYEVNVRGSN